MCHICKLLNKRKNTNSYEYIRKNISVTFNNIARKTTITKNDLCQSLQNSIQSDIDCDLFISNYAYLSTLILKDIDEINARIQELTALDKSEPTEKDYLHRKIRYFIGINQKALKEISDYISNEMFMDIQKYDYNFSDRSDDTLLHMLLLSKYSYNFYKRYYDFYYDFSVEAKIRFIPGITLDNYLDTISTFIDLKKNDYNDYQSRLSKIIIEHDVLEYLCERVETHNILNRRLEIFNILKYLYDNEKWQSFISLAILQIEGLFYDCCIIKKQSDLSKTAGTYIEKVEKSFRDNDIIMLSVSPYFMYDIPDIRNEIAHTGYFLSDDLKHTANELIFDLNTLIKWIYDITHEKYTILKMLYDRLTEHPNIDLNKKVELLVYEMFANTAVSDYKYLNLLKDPISFGDEIAYMKTPVGYWENIIIEIMDVVKTEVFWSYVESMVKPYDGANRKLYDFILFAEKLKNTFIPILDKKSPEKIACQKVASKIQRCK